MYKKAQSKKFFEEYLPLGLILFAGLVVRLVFFTGLARGGDALNYAHAAYSLSNGVFEFDAWAGMSRIGLIFPIAILYKLVGPSDFSTLAFPFLCSLASIFFIYSVTKLYAGGFSGQISALIWAFLPLDILLSTSLLADGPLATLSTASVFVFLLAESKPKKTRPALFSLSAVLLAWAVLIKPLAAITLIFFLVHILFKQWPGIRKSFYRFVPNGMQIKATIVVLFLVISILVGLILLIQPRPFLVTLMRSNNDLGAFLFTGSSELDFGGQDFSQSNLFVFVAPLFLVSIAGLITKKKVSALPILIWAATYYVYYEWGSVKPNPTQYSPIEPFKEARNMLFLLAPFVVVTGLYLGNEFRQLKIKWLAPTVALSAAGIAVFTKNILNLGGWTWWTSIAFLVALLATFSIPFLRNKDSRLRLVTFYLLLFSLCVGMLQPFLPYHAVNFSQSNSNLVFLENTQLWDEYYSLPIYSNNPPLVNYASKFQLGYAWLGQSLAGHQYRLQDSPIPVNQSGLVVQIGAKHEVPPNWWLIESSPEKSVHIYRVLDEEEADRELNAALQEMANQSSIANLKRLYGASVNALNWDLLFSSWIKLHAISPRDYPLDEIVDEVIEFIYLHPPQASDNILKNSDFSNGLTSWTHPDIDEVDLLLNSVAAMPAEIGKPGFSQEVVLQPNEIYLFSIHISSTETLPIDVLRVHEGTIVDSSAVEEIIGNLEERVSIFVTPDWDGPQQIAIEMYSPGGQGRIRLQNPILIQIGTEGE